MQIGNFYVGKVNIEKIRYRCKKVGCDYFDRYPTAFEDSYGVERAPSKVRVIEIAALPSPQVSRSTASAMEVEYFDLIEISEEHLEKVWPIVEAAIEALLRLHANSPDRGRVSIESWLEET